MPVINSNLLSHTIVAPGPLPLQACAEALIKGGYCSPATLTIQVRVRFTLTALIELPALPVQGCDCVNPWNTAQHPTCAHTSHATPALTRCHHAALTSSQGGSNGGLLVAACANQRPDLYACVLGQVRMREAQVHISHMSVIAWS